MKVKATITVTAIGKDEQLAWLKLIDKLHVILGNPNIREEFVTFEDIEEVE